MKRVLSILMMCAVMATGCSKEDSNQFVPYSGNELNDTTWSNAPASTAPVRRIHPLLQLPVLGDSISGSAGGSLKLNDSLVISFPPGFCTSASGTVINDKVKIEVVQLAKKGDMIRMNKPTMSNQDLLVTGGSMFIKVTRNGEELKMATGKKLHIAMSNAFTSSTANGMKVFYGNETANVTSTQNFTWVATQDTVSNTIIQTGTGGTSIPAFGFYIDRFRWVNCDYFYNISTPKTKVTVTTPPNFTNQNTVMYAVFKTQNIVAYLYDDAAKKLFFLNNVPVGSEITLVSLTMINSQMYLGTKDIIVTNNMNVTMQPMQKTKQQIEAFLESL